MRAGGRGGSWWVVVAWWCVVGACGWGFVVGGVLPSVVGAFAVVGGGPVFSSAPGLPDGRVYEQVSPADKNGNEAGSGTAAFDVGGLNHYGLAAGDGDSVLFEGTGAMGESPWAVSQYFVASKNQGAAGWGTRAATPAAQQSLVNLGGLLFTKLWYLDPSADLTHMLVEAGGIYTLAPAAENSCGAQQIYLAGSNPFVAAVWLEAPAPGVADPVQNCSIYGESGAPVGGSPDFSTVYFTYPGTLLAADASRAPHAGSGPLVEAWGFYEDREGVLREAGVLPDGNLDEFGAVPAASGHGRNPYGNQVSPDGSRAFFVSPDPASCAPAGRNDCVTDPPELYVRVNGETTLLVSKDTQLPETGGLPGAAPNGVLQMHNPSVQYNNRPALDGSYVFASPDGSQAFFQSEDQLTAEAPSGGSVKTYDFDVNTGVLRYLPGVAGQIVASDTDGSEIVFVRPEVGGAPAELDLWTAGPAGGSVTAVTQLPGVSSSGLRNGEYVSEAQMSSDGSSLAFTTASRLCCTFNSGGLEQVYRFDVASNTLGCVSCPPAGVTPSGDASMSVLRASETYEAPLGEIVRGMVSDRGMSADGDRIFFDSPDPLVSRDANSDSPEVEIGENTRVRQGRDVYEWENGVVYLISTGKSARDSFLLDSSEDGDDVFFATAEGLVAGDTDGGFDVYDARVPRPGDTPAATAVPCEGSVCQGPPSIPVSVTVPASAAFSGLGNPVSVPPVKLAATPKPSSKAKKCKRGYVRKKNRCVRRSKRAGGDGRVK
jgi:hypothetical protein